MTQWKNPVAREHQGAAPFPGFSNEECRQRGATPVDGQVEADLRQPHSMPKIVFPRGGLGKPGIVTGEDFLRASPLPIDWGENPRQDACALLRALFLPDEYVFAAWNHRMPARLGTTVRTRREWEQVFRTCPQLPCLFLPNPVGALPRRTQHGKWSCRGSTSIVSFRHAIVEFEAIPEDEQFPVWASMDLANLSALVSTGVGTLQGIVRVNAPNEAAWKAGYEKKWLPMGCKPRCAVSASLARMAGGKRSLVTKAFCRTHAAEAIPPLVQQGLWYVRPELVVGGDS